MPLAEITAMYLAVGIVAGLFATLFGFGGGFLVVPVVLWSLGHAGLSDNAATHMAIATSLAVMIFNALNATLAHGRRGNIDWRILLRLSPFVAGGAILGVWGAGYLSGAVLRYVFVAYLLYTLGLALLRRDMVRVGEGGFRSPGLGMLAGFGVVVGVVSGALGVGGSVLTVPFLRRRRLPMQRAAALAAPLSLPISLAGTVTVVAMGTNGIPVPPGSLGLIYLPAAIGIAIGCLAGVPLGVRVSGRLPDRLYARIYLGLLAATAVAVAIGG